MLNPINRSNSRAGAQRYKVEPYVVAGDIYAEAPHVGRGGWTWYTGSAGWLYRAGMEWILGFRVRGMTLSIDPCIPRNWPGYSMNFGITPRSITFGWKILRMLLAASLSRSWTARYFRGSVNIPLDG